MDLPRAAVWKTLQGSELSVKCGAGSDIVSIVPRVQGEDALTAIPSHHPFKMFTFDSVDSELGFLTVFRGISLRVSKWTWQT